ncbi:hypothetical protein COV20_03665 [Candidatus Woesearchaeota archaeon CG10_big_fil_rev_8_21_14_0_10_45_16]|nr:MAG: hypothetical protein COV20_03665 [Candidatus Woesearchaeota archaeon CG10_big_fil_rev_8_21_14_0_10_45_16]
MSYEIPRNLTKYAEEFLFGLSLKQFLYALGFIGGTLILYMSLAEKMNQLIVFAIILPFLILGFLFVFLQLDEKIKAQFNLRRSLYKASYFDTNISSFIDVEDIRDDIVILKNGNILGILEVTPVDFFMLSPEQKTQVMTAYRNWLRSIDYYVQILSRSVNISLDSWLNSIEKKATKDDNQRANHFREWMKEEMGKNNIRDRRFYVIIPQKIEMRRRSLLAELKSIVTGNYDSELSKDDLSRYKIQLQNNLINCSEMMERCSLTAKRLKTDELLGLYASYFRNESVINKTVLSPLTWMDELLQEEMPPAVENDTKKIGHETIQPIGHTGS